MKYFMFTGYVSFISLLSSLHLMCAADASAGGGSSHSSAAPAAHGSLNLHFACGSLFRED